jgi:hypothetical protein
MPFLPNSPPCVHGILSSIRSTIDLLTRDIERAEQATELLHPLVRELRDGRAHLEDAAEALEMLVAEGDEP